MGQRIPSVAPTGACGSVHPMNPSPVNVPDLLSKYGLKPEKRLGQNFLIDPVYIDRIVEAAAVSPTDSVLEIGAGLGSLTRSLAASANKVVAVELDPSLIAPLTEVLRSHSNVRIVQGDILDIDPGQLMDASDYLVVANIPYYITSAVIRHLLGANVRPARMALTLQHEVAERICAAPGNMSLLSLSVQIYGKPAIAMRIPPGAFYPIPKVDSAVVRIALYPKPIIPAPLLEDFFRLTKAGFGQKRKTLRNSLSAGLHLSREQTEKFLSSAGIEPRRRAQTLSLAEWRRLVDTFGTMDKN
jgi:16S rRNA (adenine1518-N6/adenine1519-N6)-dimethyltransferase